MRRPPENSASALTPFATVEDRVEQSTELWAQDLRRLFEQARERFADVSWETDQGDRVWAHKAVVYVRAPKAFKDRYFLPSHKSVSRSPTSLSVGPSPFPGGQPRFPSSSTSLLTSGSARNTPSPSYFQRHGSSLSVHTAESDGTLRPPTLSTNGGGTPDTGVLRLAYDDAPELFRAQLEWLYTGEGFGDVVEWISTEDENGGSGGGGGGGSVRDSLGRRGNLADRRDKLGQDLTYMWTSKLYCDVRIHLDSPAEDAYDSDTSESSDDSLASTVIFTAHRFMLVFRSPYFASVLLNPNNFCPATADVHLPTPPFTPAALHFCLGWIYAGHLDFSNRSFDLLTAFQIHRAAMYLQLDALVNELESRLVYDFCHGLDWDRCRCRRCVTRVARVWRFAGSSDVGALELQRRARRFILSGWGDTWGREIATADASERDDLVKDVMNGLTPKNVVTAFRNVERVRARMEYGLRTKGPDAAAWVDVLSDMIEPVEKSARDLLRTHFAAVCESKDMWNVLLGIGFSDDVLDIMLREVVDIAAKPPGFLQAPKMYQTLVSGILLKVNPDTHETILPHRSLNREKVDAAKDGILAHIRRRWMAIKEENGFGELEPWALKEISDEVDVSVDDLLGPRQVPFPRPGGFPRTSSRPARLTDAGSTRSRSASLASEASQASVASTSTFRSPPPQSTPEPAEPNGLRRLRLSSSASTTSVASAGRAATRAVAAASRQSAGPGPLARSPTAAGKTVLVSLGSKNRASTSARPGPQSPTPRRSPQVMSGPPRPLITGMGRTPVNKVQAAAAAEAASPGSPSPRAGSPATELRRQSSHGSLKSVSSVRTTATTASTQTTATTRTATSVKSNATAKSSATAKTTATTKTAASKAPRTSAVATAQPKAATSASSQSKAAARLAAGKPSAAPPRVRSTSTASTKSKAPSVTQSQAPPVPGRPASTKPILAPASTKAPAKPALKSSSSSKSLRAAAAATKGATKPPMPAAPQPKTPTVTKTPTAKTPTTKTPTSKPTTTKVSTSNGNLTPSSSSSTRVRATSLNPRATPPSAPRIRTSSAATPWKRATPLPPSVAGVRPRQSIRSSSGSTEGAPEAITPRLSEIIEPVILSDDSETPDIHQSKGEPDAKALAEAIAEADIEVPVSLEVPSTATEVPAVVAVPAPVEAAAPARRERRPIEIPKVFTAEDTAASRQGTPTGRLSQGSPTEPPGRAMGVEEQSATSSETTPTPQALESEVRPFVARAATGREQPRPNPPVRASTTPAVPIPTPTISSPLASNPNASPKSVASANVLLNGSPVSTMSRVVSEGGSQRSSAWHPAHAFDPPRKAAPPPPPMSPPKIEITDDNKPFSGPGVSLHVGIPCIVTLSHRRARFRANVKYLGSMADAHGLWVGLEVDDLERHGVETLSTGARGGIRYFHFTPAPPAPQPADDTRSLRQRRLAAIADSLPGSRRPSRLGLGLSGTSLAPPDISRRAVSPFAPEWGPPEAPRALFVRPSEVVFVMGAE